MNQNPRNKRVAIIGSLALLLFLLSLFLSFNHIGKEKVTLEVAPSSARVEVDGKPTNDKILYLSPEKHRFVFKLDNFVTVDKEVDISKPGERDIEVGLDPSNSVGDKYLEDHVAYQQEREAIGSREFGRTSKKLDEKYPFLDKLPINGRTFSVNYGESILTPTKDEDDATIALYIDAISAEDRRTAVYYVGMELSIDPSTVEYVFEGLNNPFQQEHPDE